MADVYRARSAFAFTDKQGVPRVITVGHLMSSDDPNFKGKEKLFEPVETAAARAAGVEDATAEPGALRSLSTPRRGRGRKSAFTEEPAPEPTPEPAPTAESAKES